MLRDPDNLSEFFLQLVGLIVIIATACGFLSMILKVFGA